MFATVSVLTVAVAHTVLAAADPEARRLRRVERDPRVATPADLDALVRAHGVGPDRAWTVADRIEAAGLEASLVWSWTMQYDGVELADLCGSRLTHDEVRAHLVARSTLVAGADLLQRSA